MKLIRFMPALLLCSTLFISCTNTYDEDLQLVKKNQIHFADDNGGDTTTTPPPNNPDGGS
ncbi:hypothetical protein [Lutibacter sp.]|uniref:hypothetical protein n=1 Tax=Lutibacter sp. TaxID=1925666 RepID=UPI0025BDF67A|nr:hypothetical protein [Lutibacter sp.]MCF6182722.1 hypothetical protein [Lutibacter sp.]